MPTEQTPYEIFISYSRKDDQPIHPGEPGWVTALRDHILADHRRFITERSEGLFKRDGFFIQITKVDIRKAWRAIFRYLIRWNDWNATVPVAAAGKDFLGDRENEVRLRGFLSSWSG